MKNKEEIISGTKNKSGANTAKVLIEALPYIQKLAGAIIIIKFGGNAMVDEKL